MPQTITSEPITGRQLSYARSLGADETALSIMDKRTCSRYIEALIIKRRDGGPVTETPQPIVQREPERFGFGRGKLNIPAQMVQAIPTGYYAWAPDFDTPLRFVRIKHHDSGRKRGHTTVQTIHGDELKLQVDIYPNGQMQVYRNGLDDLLTGILVDPTHAGRTYALKKGRCMRCGKELTDERSRHYGIGPICDGILPQVIDRRDEELGFSYEERPVDYKIEEYLR